YDTCLILKQGVEITPAVRHARLRLMAAARAGLARTLGLLGMDAPERMEREEAAVGEGSRRRSCRRIHSPEPSAWYNTHGGRGRAGRHRGVTLVAAPFCRVALHGRRAAQR
ncbi:MAG TPA: DALR anticodon-binding domain-containing protein, partial [Longimicrobiales bacterium]